MLHKCTDVKSIKDKLQHVLIECAKETYRVVRENLGYCCVISEIQSLVAICTPDLQRAVTLKKDGGVFLQSHTNQKSGSITQIIIKVKKAFNVKYSIGNEVLL